jgi:hypothetical protein
VTRVIVGMILASLLPTACAAPPRKKPMDTVLAALAAEEAAPIERVRLFVEQGDVMDVYYVDRARPGRFRMIKNPRQRGPELIVVDGMQWTRSGAGWQKSRARPTTGQMPSIAQLFRAGLSDPIERPGPDGGHSIEGGMAWTDRTSCKGKLLMRIDAAGLPSLLHFEGVCGGKLCRFRQAFSYVGPVTILPPE